MPFVIIDEPSNTNNDKITPNNGLDGGDPNSDENHKDKTDTSTQKDTNRNNSNFYQNNSRANSNKKDNRIVSLFSNLINDIKEFLKVTKLRNKAISAIVLILLIVPLFITFLNSALYSRQYLAKENDIKTNEPSFFDNIYKLMTKNEGNKIVGSNEFYNPIDGEINKSSDGTITYYNTDNGKDISKLSERPAGVNDFSSSVKKLIPIKIRITNQDQQAIGHTGFPLNNLYEIVYTDNTKQEKATLIKIEQVDPALDQSNPKVQLSINSEIAKRLGVADKVIDEAKNNTNIILDAVLLER